MLIEECMNMLEVSAVDSQQNILWDFSVPSLNLSWQITAEHAENTVSMDWGFENHVFWHFAGRFLISFG